MKQLKRGAGILLAVSSLPSKYGIGTLGTEAYHFVDMLADLKQTYWQVLPLGPTGLGDSPYQSFSAFAGKGMTFGSCPYPFCAGRHALRDPQRGSGNA